MTGATYENRHRDHLDCIMFAGIRFCHHAAAFNRCRSSGTRRQEGFQLSAARSPPLVVSFNTQLINQVNFRLPRLENEREANHFDAAPRLELLDGDATPIPVKLDILAITSTAKTIDYEVEVERYNKSAKRASLPQFATMMADDSTLLSGVSELDAIPPQSQVLTEQRLKYWFKLADPQTRNTFLQWAEKQPSS